MSTVSEQPQPLTDIEYKLLLIAYIHTLPDDSLNKGRVISTLFASAGPVGNNPASMPQLLSELKVESVGEIEAAVNGFALGAKRDLLVALKKTRTSVLNALPPDFPAGSREEADVHVKPVLGAIAKKVQALQQAAARDPEPAAAAEDSAAAAAPAKPPPQVVRAMIWQPPIAFTHAQRLGSGEDTSLRLTTFFDGDLVLGAGMLMYRIRVENQIVRVQHYEMYGEHRVVEDAAFPMSQRFVIGRGAQADHQRPDQDVDMGSRGLSRMHVAVKVDFSAQLGMLTIELEDLGSTNGTPVWWNDPQGAPPVKLACRQVLDGNHGRTLETTFEGDLWLSAGSMLYHLTMGGGVINVNHEGANLQGRAPLAPVQHPLNQPFIIGRDPSVQHPIGGEHPGAMGLSRKHVTVHVQESPNGMRLRVDDHSSNGTTVWWDPPK
ncbi:MAG: FHA domain-containing protein [Acidobacteriota bacterium]